MLAHVVDRRAEILAGVGRQQAVDRQLQPAWRRRRHRHVTILLTSHRTKTSLLTLTERRRPRTVKVIELSAFLPFNWHRQL